MRITMIMLTKGLGGGEKIFTDIVQAIAQKGHTVQAVCHPDFLGKHFLSHKHIRVDTLKVRSDISPLAIFKLYKLLNQFKPDLVHTHLARASKIAGLITSRLKIASVANIHNYVKLKYYKNIDFMFPGTMDLKNYLVSNGTAPKRIMVIPHFSMVPAVSKPGFKAGDHLNLVSFGRFSPEKGFPVLLEAIKILKARGIRASLKLGGDGPEKTKLESLIRQWKIEDDVQLTGWVHDVTDFFTKGSVFILPSLKESFGIVLLEAMSQGKVIVSSKAPGPCQILDQSTALMFPVGDSEALADKLQSLYENPEQASALAENALNRFNEKYTHEKVIPMLESSYRHIIKEIKGQ